MRQITYLGPSQNIGRFGAVTTGAKLYLTEDEFHGVADDPDYQLENAGEYEQARLGILPSDSMIYRLTALPWNNGKLCARLRGKSKRVLLRIARAMQACGVSHVSDDSTLSRTDLAESIAKSAAIEGWTVMDDGHLKGHEGRDLTPTNLAPPANVKRRRPKPIAAK